MFECFMREAEIMKKENLIYDYILSKSTMESLDEFIMNSINDKKLIAILKNKKKLQNGRRKKHRTTDKRKSVKERPTQEKPMEKKQLSMIDVNINDQCIRKTPSKRLIKSHTIISIDEREEIEKRIV